MNTSCWQIMFAWHFVFDSNIIMAMQSRFHKCYWSFIETDPAAPTKDQQKGIPFTSTQISAMNCHYIQCIIAISLIAISIVSTTILFAVASNCWVAFTCFDGYAHSISTIHIFYLWCTLVQLHCNRTREKVDTS